MFGQFTKNYSIFLPKKLQLSSQKYGFGIRALEKNLFWIGSWIPDSGAKNAPDPGSATATLMAPIVYIL